MSHLIPCVSLWSFRTFQYNFAAWITFKLMKLLLSGTISSLYSFDNWNDLSEIWEKLETYFDAMLIALSLRMYKTMSCMSRIKRNVCFTCIGKKSVEQWNFIFGWLCFDFIGSPTIFNLLGFIVRHALLHHQDGRSIQMRCVKMYNFWPPMR